MEKIKLIMSDLDGTLLTKKKIVTKKTIETIKKLKNQGYKFGLATGRNPSSILKTLQEFHLDKELIDVIVGLNGASIYFVKEDLWLSNDYLEKEVYRDIIATYPQFTFCTYLGDKMYASKKNLITKKVAQYNKLKLVAGDLVELIEGSIPKLIAFAPFYRIRFELKKIKKNQDMRYHAFTSGPNLIEFMARNTSKAQGIEKVCAHYGLTLDNCLAFGDEQNDLEMLQRCGIGVSMKNARKEIKVKSDFITKYTNEKDGVACFIDDFLLK